MLKVRKSEHPSRGKPYSKEKQLAVDKELSETGKKGKIPDIKKRGRKISESLRSFPVIL